MVHCGGPGVPTATIVPSSWHGLMASPDRLPSRLGFFVREAREVQCPLTCTVPPMPFEVVTKLDAPLALPDAFMPQAFELQHVPDATSPSGASCPWCLSSPSLCIHFTNGSKADIVAWLTAQGYRPIGRDGF